MMLRYVTSIFCMILATSAHAEWSVSVESDRMTGKTQAYATSDRELVAVNSLLPSVYGWFGVGCSGNDEWAFIGFNRSEWFGLAANEYRASTAVTRTRIRFDAQLESTDLEHLQSDRFYGFRWDKDVIANLMRSNSVLLELPVIDGRTEYLEVSLKGSTAAIGEMRSKCRN